MNQSGDNDYFILAVPEANVSLILCLIFSVCASVIIPLLFFAIIWYQKNCTDDSYLTLMNKLGTLLFWCGIEYFTVCQSIESFIFIYGPLPINICLFARIIRSAYFLQFLLYFDLIILSRYVYIFQLKNPMAFNADFWACFFNIWVKLTGLISQTVWHMVIKSQALNYYICTGQDPTYALQHPTK